MSIQPTGEVCAEEVVVNKRNATIGRKKLRKSNELKLQRRMQDRFGY
jgi:hypothetical protein